jgi:hypothetical protein
LNFYGKRTSGTIGVAVPLKTNPTAIPKEPLFANAPATEFKTNVYICTDL